MRRTTIGWHLVSALALSAPVAELTAQDPQVASVAAERWTNEELDNLLAPIALYPDPILAQVLVAATYPDQVLAAQAHVRAFGTESIDQMPWEISVKAVARYEPVLNLLAEGEDWMTALGQAYATQPTDVMDAVQRLRQMANAQGNLQTTTQQQVVVEREVIRIVPAEPRVIYVPTYDPAVIYHRPVYVTHAHPAYWSWGVAYPIGVWLTYDVDWWGHRVYHHGWHTHGPHWVVVARPWIVISPIYVAPRHTVIVVNRGVVHRRWDTRVVRRYSTVHRNTTFERHDRGFRRDDRVGRGRAVANGNRVVPLPSGGNARAARSETPRANTPRRDVTPTATGTARSGNGTWNPRPTRERAVPAPSTQSPRAGTATPRATTPRATTPRATTPRATTPRATTPRATTPRSGGTAAPSGSGNPAPRASAPRSDGNSTPRASTPRGGGSSTPHASAPRSGGGGAARGSGGSRGNGGGSGGSRGRPERN